jgi:hypothetical protein
MKAQYRHYGCRITDDLTYKGIKTLFMENELIRIGILLDKGADIFQLIDKQSDTDFLWKSPNGITTPSKYRETIASDSGSFLDHYHGGWQDIFPGGGPANYKGAEIGLHGEITQLGWEYTIIEDTEESIKIEFTVDCIRTPFRIEKTIEIKRNNPSIFIVETITNLSEESLEFMWGHHPAIGAPFLKEGVKLIVPAEKGEVHSPKFMESGIFNPGQQFDWPMINTGETLIDLSTVGAENAGYGDLIYLKDLKAGWYAILDQEKKLGFGLAWPKEIFSCIWFWFVYGQSPGYPWWNRIYCLSLEPWSSATNSLTKAIEQNTTLKIKGGESITIPLTAVVIKNADEINNIKINGTVT